MPYKEQRTVAVVMREIVTDRDERAWEFRKWRKLIKGTSLPRREVNKHLRALCHATTPIVRLHPDSLRREARELFLYSQKPITAIY